MSLFDLFLKFSGGGGAKLLGFLDDVKVYAPDLAGTADTLKQLFQSQVDPAHLAKVVDSTKHALSEIAHGHVKPHDDPSSAI